MMKYFYFISIIFTISYSENVKILFDSNSTISYIGSHPAHNWTGVSDNFKGGIICNDTSLNECFIKIVAPIKSFDSKNSARDSNMLLYTESKKYPYAKFTSNQVNIFNSLDTELMLSGRLEFHGVTKNISVNIALSSKGDMLLGTTEFVLSLEEYGVNRPELLFIPISDEIKITCKLLCDNKIGLLKNGKK